MKNMLGRIAGFILGAAGFLVVFKFVFLDNIPREDELAPGLVMIAAILSGVVFAFIGARIQHYVRKKETTL